MIRLAVATLLFARLAAAAPSMHEYHVQVNEALSRLSVSACLAGAPAVLEARARDAADFLRSARHRESGESLVAKRNVLKLPGHGGCVDYVVDLAGASRVNDRYARVHERNVVASPSLWLWRPRSKGVAKLRVRFDVPAGMRVSVPWEPIKNEPVPTYFVPMSPESDDAVAAFGHFDQCEIAVAGARLRVAVLRGVYAGDSGTLYDWIRAAADNVTLTYGRFPNPAPQVLIVPTARHDDDDREPVPFGHVIRDGGEAIQFFVNQKRPLQEFLADWTATHEFSHLLIPYISSNEKWISEGLASYYQNVLMARAGDYSDEKAWRKIIEGFGRGERSVPHLTLENAMPIGSWDGIMKTYWGGAAVFLFADLELRAQSGGAESLDSVLERFQSCCLPSARTWDGRSLFRKLDRLTEHPVFERLYDEHRSERRFPDYHAALERLGLSLRAGRVTKTDTAPLADVRDAIMARPRALSETAFERRGCGVTESGPWQDARSFDRL